MKHAAALSLFSIVLMPLLVQASIGVPPTTPPNWLVMEETMGSKEYRLDMTAEPVWESVRLGDLSFEVPYTSRWTVDEQSFPSIMTTATSSISFGRYRSAGTYITREYQLDVVPARSLDTITWLETGSCFSTIPEVVTVGKWRGVKYQYGGAKGCSVNFEIPMDGFNIAVGQVYDIGKDEMDMSEEMLHIIRSIEMKTK